MLRNALARFRAVRMRITIVATVLTGVALTLSAVLLVSAVQHRLKAQVRADTEQAAADVAFALQAGQPFDRAVTAPPPGTLVYIVSGTGDVLAASGGMPPATCRRSAHCPTSTCSTAGYRSRSPSSSSPPEAARSKSSPPHLLPTCKGR